MEVEKLEERDTIKVRKNTFWGGGNLVRISKREFGCLVAFTAKPKSR